MGRVGRRHSVDSLFCEAPTYLTYLTHRTYLATDAGTSRSALSQTKSSLL